MKSEIESFGAVVEKFIGDAVMAVFGAPVSHGDDTERAVRAGLRVLDAVQELNREDPALDLTVRVAVNTGEAIAQSRRPLDAAAERHYPRAPAWMGRPLAYRDARETTSTSAVCV